MVRLALTRAVQVFVLGSALSIGAAVAAQPRGPADIISGAKKAQKEKEMVEGVERAAPADAADSSAPATSPADASAAPEKTQSERTQRAREALMSPQLSQTSPKSDIPSGTIVVRVLDADSTPVADANVRVGILKSDGSRDEVKGRSDASGVASFGDLPVGDQQAYRVSVSAEGASVGANPFRLPHDRGYEVSLRRLKTTTDLTKIVLYVGAVSVELKDERLKVAEQVRLINIDRAAYVFPEEGLLIKLPDGFTAFQTQETMGDQRVSSDEQGVRIKGSLPPGQTTLLWGFDLPVAGTEMTIALDNPFNTYAFRVLVDAVPGLSVKVDDMPAPEQHESQGAHFWVTEVARKVEQGPFKTVRLHLTGIPGPGPSRWIAAGLALLVLAAGTVLSTRSQARSADPAESLAVRKREVIARLESLSAEHERGEVGPEYFASEKARLTDALAVLLWEEQELKRGTKAA